VAEKIYRDATTLRGQRRTVTILCTDLRDFTTLSEGLAPDQVAAQLNEYFPMMVEAIQRFHGIIIDFVGDAVLAVYGAPWRIRRRRSTPSAPGSPRRLAWSL
jgi:class 3 adenylate cyclase